MSKAGTNLTGKRFVLFSLHSHLPQFVINECLVGDCLIENAADVQILRPLLCTCHLAESFTDQGAKAHACSQCEDEERIVRLSTPKCEHGILQDFADPKDNAEIEGLMASLSGDDVGHFEADGIPFGKIALYDILLKYKKSDILFRADEPAWPDFQATVRACLYCARWFERYLAKNGPIDGLVVYNSNYSINRTLCRVAEKHNIPWYSIHGGASLRATWDTLMLTKGSIDQRQLALPKNWQAGYGERVMSRQDVRTVGEHFEELFLGTKSHAYSSPAGSTPTDDIISRVNPSGDRKIILAATSSVDERLAIEESGIRVSHPPESFVFPTQFDWLKFLIEKTANDPSVALIIRVHPREFPNKREGFTSVNAVRLQELLVDLPENITVNWPKDNISFYDLLFRADLVLSAWSTVLLEASLFGCPIVLPKNPTPGYQCVADKVCLSKEDYWKQVRHFIEQPWSLERSIKTFRWYWMIQSASVLSLRSTGKRPLAGWAESKEYGWRRLCALLAKKGLFVAEHRRHRRTYWGSPEMVGNRRTNIQAEPVITKTLAGEFDPLEDFSAMQILQGNPAASLSVTAQDADEENEAVRTELQKMTDALRGLAKHTSTQVNHDKVPV